MTLSFKWDVNAGLLGESRQELRRTHSRLKWAQTAFQCRCVKTIVCLCLMPRGTLCIWMSWEGQAISNELRNDSAAGHLFSCWVDTSSRPLTFHPDAQGLGHFAQALLTLALASTAQLPCNLPATSVLTLLLSLFRSRPQSCTALTVF